MPSAPLSNLARRMLSDPVASRKVHEAVTGGSRVIEFEGQTYKVCRYHELPKPTMTKQEQQDYYEKNTFYGALERLRRSMPRFIQALFWGYWT